MQLKAVDGATVISHLTMNDMNMKQISALKYYVGFALMVIVFYVYSGVVGWNWFGSATTHKNEYKTHGQRYLHK